MAPSKLFLALTHTMPPTKKPYKLLSTTALGAEKRSSFTHLPLDMETIILDDDGKKPSVKRKIDWVQTVSNFSWAGLVGLFVHNHSYELATFLCVLIFLGRTKPL